MFGPESRIPIRSTAVACAVLRPAGDGYEVLVLKRTLPPLDGVWSLVTGHVDEGETGARAAGREVVEETGLQPTALYSANFCDQWYNAHVNVIELVPVFVAYVDAGADVDLNHEHSDLRWLAVDDAIARIPFHGHKTALEHIRHTFIENAPPVWLKVSAE
ncbi:MAG: NUDIX domain-containing protein [Alphaproteobacteria bacterium]|nr:NUDIX domain-containing protein [Alphaproteobacteria bacterium]MBF0249743.1 NUDIX domain-containing protein [Alphaproteobacteria bacterium]